MSETTNIPLSSDDCSDDNDYSGYACDINPKDLFIVSWVCIWLILTSIMFYWLQRGLIESNTNDDTNKNKQSGLLAPWKLGYVTCAVIYIRELTYVISWIFWISTFDYSPTSPCFITHNIAHILWAFSGASLYLFFIHRLYTVYNQSDNDMFEIKLKYYVILLVLDLLYFISLIVIAASWWKYNNIRYALMNGISLILEIIMTMTISILFSKPILRVTIMKRRYSDNKTKSDTNTKEVYHNDKLLSLLTKLLILSGIALGTTAFARCSIVISYSICEEECALIFISYATWSIDTFMNIFCILSSFKSGDTYYQRFCNKLHKHILEHYIGSVVEKQLDKNDQKVHITTSQK